MKKENLTSVQKMKLETHLLATIRLKEVMATSGYTQTTLIKALEEKYGEKVKKQTFSKWLNENIEQKNNSRKIDDTHADMISDILGIDKGYLRCIDYPDSAFIDSYSKYIQEKNIDSEYISNQNEYSMYKYLFHMCGFEMSDSMDSNKRRNFILIKNGKRISLEHNQLRKIIRNTINFVCDQLSNLMKEGDSL